MSPSGCGQDAHFNMPWYARIWHRHPPSTAVCLLFLDILSLAASKKMQDMFGSFKRPLLPPLTHGNYLVLLYVVAVFAGVLFEFFKV